MFLTRMFQKSKSLNPTTKIARAAQATHDFLNAFHRDGHDQGFIASFGKDTQSHAGFTYYEAEMHAGVDAVIERVKASDEPTALYDSMVETAEIFACQGMRDRPWLSITITDGKDNHSRKYANNPRRAGDAYRRLMQVGLLPISVLIGVGNDQEIDENALKTLSDAGGIAFLRAQHMQELAAILLRLTTSIEASVRTITVSDGQFSISKTTPQAQVHVVPFLYSISLDRSGSMKEEA